ncbi:MAG: hypothetical protein GWN01_14555 [Nitrosopumilaceae archaeon]|nr:hypothetical protein [Nitrosopumilaceae archaeon]NIX62679.1 hypothetical protein [Nitrosopumilaceae archaeon]
MKYCEIKNLINVAKSRPWGWPARKWPEDAYQEIAILVILQKTELKNICKALESLARKMGYRRFNIEGGRKWQHESIPRPIGYRQSKGKRKREARMKVSPSRRREIARMGALARWGKS